MTIRTHNRVAAVIVAAGRGERAGAAEGPKQYRRIGPWPVIRHTLEVFLAHPAVGPVAVAIHADDRDLFREAAGPLADRVIVVNGGASRQESTRQALLALRDRRPDFVLIHDGVRPFVDAALIGRTIEAVDAEHGALAALPVTDTLKRGEAGGIVAETVLRDGLHAAQTPQAFPYGRILAAHEDARASRRDFTDDAAIAEWAGIPVRLVEGSPDNVKLTWARDIERADRLLRAPSPAFPDVRTGSGYDVHAFAEGGHVTLCGVKIPHGRGLAGHSDADVALHALTDALLGTCGLGDIGDHFPPSDQRWKGAASRVFLEHAVRLLRQRRARIVNADITLICEEPKIGPHRAAMMAELADILGIADDRVSVKATTNERLGFVGRGEGIAAIATAAVAFPGEVPE